MVTSSYLDKCTRFWLSYIIQAMSVPTKQQLRERFIKQLNDGDVTPLNHCVKFNDDLLVSTIANFIAAFPAFSLKLYNLHGHVNHLGSRLGRGEVLVYFIFDDVELGGSSSSIDCFVNDKPVFEIKSGKKVGERYVDFMLGIDEVQASLKYFYRILKLFEKAEKSGKLLIPQNFANIPKSKIDDLKIACPIAYKRSEEKYFIDLLEGPIGTKKFLILDRDVMLPVFYGNFKRDNLKLERISGGLVRLSYIFK
jgi:hypothetical protein